MKKILLIIIILISNQTFGQKAKPNKEDTFKFIIKMLDEASFNGYDGAGNKKMINYEIINYDISKLKINIMKNMVLMSGPLKGTEVTKSYYNLNDIKYVNVVEHDSKILEIKLGFVTSYKYEYIFSKKTYLIDKNFDKSTKGTGTEAQFIFADKSKANKLKKALLHLKSIVGVKDNLFD